MKKLSRVAVGVLATLTLLTLTAPSALAETRIFSDPSGDSTNPYADITSVGATYNPTAVALSLTTINFYGPSSFGPGDVIIWDVDTNGDSEEEYSVFLDDSGSSVYQINGGTLGPRTCDADNGSNASTYIVAFSASCIGTPASIRIRGYIHVFTGAYDFAPSTSFSPAIQHDIPVTTTTTPPPPVDPPVTTAGVHDGYWMLSQNGQVYGFGTANGAQLSNSQPFVHIEPTPTGTGYWALTEGGNILTKGDASALPSIGVSPGERAVSLSATPSGHGLWVFTDRGRVVTLGDAQPFGDMSGIPLNGKVVGSVATPTGKGYWMVGSDGGIFSFGDAKFHGSTGNLTLNKPVMAMAPASDNSGYWLVASDGGIFAFDVPFYGSMGSTPLNKPVSGMVPGKGGYMMVAQDGGIFSFGNVAFHGSLGATPPSSPVISVALQP